MRKKSMFLWYLLAAMTMSACSEHNELPSGTVSENRRLTL